MTNKLERVLVALDLSDMDKTLLRYVAAQHSFWGAEKIYFVHIMPDFTMPENADAEFHKLFSTDRPVDERIRDKIGLDVEQHLRDLKEVSVEIEVIEGKPYDKLLHWIDVKEIDLLVVGHKRQSEGSGILPRRVARKADCNILFVSDNPKMPEKILVPIDFSENSGRALQFAIDYSKRLPSAEVDGLHIVEAPPEKYYLSTAATSGFREMLLESSRIAYKKMLDRENIDAKAIHMTFLKDDYVNISTRISDYIEHHAVDLVVIGAKGHSAIEKFFYGSVTERLVEETIKAPVLVVR